MHVLLHCYVCAAVSHSKLLLCMTLLLYLPFRHHDNRYSADWIRLYTGLSKISEDGNSCPKSHKAARFD